MGQDEESSEEDFDDIEEGELEPSVTVEVSGLSLYTRHGVSEAERELGQRLVFDITLRLPECDATVTDRVEDTADYAEVCEQVALAAQERSYRTLERLVHRRGRSPARPFRRRGGRGEGRQARAAHRPAGGRGRRRGVEGGLVALRAGAGQRPSPPRTWSVIGFTGLSRLSRSCWVWSSVSPTGLGFVGAEGVELPGEVLGAGALGVLLCPPAGASPAAAAR